MRKIYTLLTILSVFCCLRANAQWGYFSGSLQTNTNFFIRDPKIGAANLPHYDNLKVGTDIWFNLNYHNEKYQFEGGVRFDAFVNSILRTPVQPYTGVGIGNFYLKKQIKDITITGGYIYDQIGSGIIFRAFEERPLGIDNALVGGRVEYNIKDMVKLKAFSGVQKFQLGWHKALISGFNAEGNFNIKDKVYLQPGVGVVNRSMDRDNMDAVVSTIESYDTTDRFVPKFNNYAFTAYNTLTAGDFSWYVEGSFKTNEAIKDFYSKLVNKPGTVFYTTASYSRKGLGITLQFKRTENFYHHISPNAYPSLFDGFISFIPPVSRQNSLRLPARFQVPALEARELAFGGEITYSPIKPLTLTFQASEIRDFVFDKPMVVDSGLDTKDFYRELFFAAQYKPNKKMEFEVGFQYTRYNMYIYRFEREPHVDAFTPFMEMAFKMSKKSSLRFEFQYQHAAKEFGQWIYGLAEFSFAPHFSIAVSDMWNFKPNPENPIVTGRNQNHYYSVFAAYTVSSFRFTVNYVKQVEGIVCTGGVCRFEPAFSGVRVAINGTF